MKNTYGAALGSADILKGLWVFGYLEADMKKKWYSGEVQRGLSWKRVWKWRKTAMINKEPKGWADLQR